MMPCCTIVENPSTNRGVICQRLAILAVARHDYTIGRPGWRNGAHLHKLDVHSQDITKLADTGDTPLTRKTGQTESKVNNGNTDPCTIQKQVS